MGDFNNVWYYVNFVYDICQMYVIVCGKVNKGIIDVIIFFFSIQVLNIGGGGINCCCQVSQCVLMVKYFYFDFGNEFLFCFFVLFDCYKFFWFFLVFMDIMVGFMVDYQFFIWVYVSDDWVVWDWMIIFCKGDKYVICVFNWQVVVI